jgi:hypothetical protein
MGAGVVGSCFGWTQKKDEQNTEWPAKATYIPSYSASSKITDARPAPTV